MFDVGTTYNVQFDSLHRVSQPGLSLSYMRFETRYGLDRSSPRVQAVQHRVQVTL